MQVAFFGKYAGLVTIYKAACKVKGGWAVHFGVKKRFWCWGRDSCNTEFFKVYGLGPFVLVAWCN